MPSKHIETFKHHRSIILVFLLKTVTLLFIDSLLLIITNIKITVNTVIPMLTCIKHILHFVSLLGYDYFLLYEHPSRNFHDWSGQEGNQFLLLYRSPVADIPFQTHIQTKLPQIIHYRPHKYLWMLRIHLLLNSTLEYFKVCGEFYQWFIGIVLTIFQFFTYL